MLAQETAALTAASGAHEADRSDVMKYLARLPAEKNGERALAARLYAEAAARATNAAERDHLTRQAARLNCG